MNKKIFMNKETWELKTQISIYQISKYREATAFEIMDRTNKTKDDYIENIRKENLRERMRLNKVWPFMNDWL